MVDESKGKKKSLVDKLNKEVLDRLDDALNCELGMSEDDSDYDLNFISQKLAKCSSYMERLSHIQMQLTKISIGANRTARDDTALLKLKEVDLKASGEYDNITPRGMKSKWVQDQLSALRKETQDWMNLARAVSEVKDAVGERAGTMKRLDSDLRLHCKLYEAKVAAGATSSVSFKVSDAKEVDLN